MRTLLFVTLLILAVPAGARETDRVSSQALQVARAGHMDRLRDASAAEIATVSHAKSRGSAAGMTTIAAGQATGVFAPPSGISADVSAGLSMALGFVSTLPVGYPEISSRLFVWMPEELAATKEEARAVLRDEYLLPALIEALPNAEVTFVPQQRGSKIQSHFSIVSPQFPADIMTFLGLQDFVLPKLETTPVFLEGEGRRYTWGHPKKQGDGLLSGFTWSNRTLNAQQQRDFLMKFSAALPKWIYIYVAPSAGFEEYPVFLNQGNVLLFKEPVNEPTLAGTDVPQTTVAP